MVFPKETCTLAATRLTPRLSQELQQDQKWQVPLLGDHSMGGEEPLGRFDAYEIVSCGGSHQMRLSKHSSTEVPGLGAFREVN